MTNIAMFTIRAKSIPAEHISFAVFSYKLAHKRQKQYHRQICTYGNKCVKTRLFIEILKEIVVNGLSIHLEADKKH